MTMPPFDPNASQPAFDQNTFQQGQPTPQYGFNPQQTPPGQYGSAGQYNTASYGQYGNFDPRAAQNIPGWRTVIPMRPLGISDTIDAIIRILKFNPRALIIFPMLVTLITSTIAYASLFLLGETKILTDVFNPNVTVGEDSFAASFSVLSGEDALLALFVIFIFLAFTAIQTIIVSVAGTRVTIASVRGYKLSLQQTWALTKPKLGSLTLRMIGLALTLTVALFLLVLVLGTALILLIALFSGGNLDATFDSGAGFLLVLLLVILTYTAGLLIYVRLMLSTSALVAEDIGPLMAIKRSLHLTKGSTGHLIGLLLLSSLLIGALGTVVSLMFTAAPAFLMVGNALNTTTITVLSYLSTFLVSIIFLPFYTAFTNVVYVNMRFKRENFHQALLYEAASR